MDMKRPIEMALNFMVFVKLNLKIDINNDELR
jgi:hypothetical protein